MISAQYVYKKPAIRLAMRLYDAFGTAFTLKRAPKKADLPHHICIIALHQIGDIVLCLPAIEAVQSMAPEAKITLIAGTAPGEILKNNPWGAEVIIFDAAWQKVVRQLTETKTAAQAAKKEFLRLMAELKPDAALVFHPDLIINQLLGKTAIKHTFGFANAGGSFRLTHPVDMAREGHQIDRNFQLAKEYSRIFQQPLPLPSLPRLKGEPSEFSYPNMVVLHPFASAPTKNWRWEYWDALITWLINQGYTPVIIGSKQDDPQAVLSIFNSPGLAKKIVNLCGKLSLLQTTGLISQARLFIGIDSGPGHIAAAVGCPVISIFSSVNDPERWHPFGEKNKTIILHSAVADREAFPYEMRNLPPDTLGNPYSDGIQPEAVIQAIKTLCPS